MDDNNNFPYGYESAPETVPGVPGESAGGLGSAEGASSQNAERSLGWNTEPPPAPGQQPIVPEAQVYAYNAQSPAPPPTYQPQPYYPPPPPQPPAFQPPPQPKKRRGGLVVFSIFVVLAVTVGVFVGVGAYRAYRATRGPDPAPGADSFLEIAETPTGVQSLAADGALTPVQVHEKLKDANVAVQLYSGRGEGSVTGEGSGIIIHEDSTGTYTYVITCAHVINKNERVSVELADGTSYDAAIVGYDDRTDVGLLRIKATGLKGAEFGDSDNLKVGEAVYAIGNPGGTEFKGSFTNGIVSAIDRPLQSSRTMQTIQHTAPINPGNSGGALVNDYGQVVGVNSAKIMDMQYEGMGFAIPSKVVQSVVNDLIAKGYVPDRPKLGIKYMAASRSQKGMLVMRINDLPSGSLIIAEIDEDSNFAGTDVQANDIITHVNGDPLNKADVLLKVIEQGKVGDTLELTIARVNAANFSVESFDVKVKLVEDKGTSLPAQEERPWYEDDQADDFGGYGLPPGFPWDW